MVQVRLAPNTANETVFETDTISMADFVKTHTGLSDYQITAQRNLGWHDFALDELWLEQDDGTLLFRGLLEAIDEKEGQNVEPTATLTGHGPGYRLETSETIFSVNNELMHNAIDRFWSNETAFSPVTVTQPSVNNTTTGTTAQEASTTAEFNEIVSPADTDPIQVTGDTVTTTQTCFTTEGENFDRHNESTLSQDSVYSDGNARQLQDIGEWMEFDFTLNHKIPSGQFTVFERYRTTGQVRVRYTLTGPSVSDFVLIDNRVDTNMTHSDLSSRIEWSDPGELEPGDYTLRLEVIPFIQENEDFTSNHDTFVALNNNQISPNSETVTDDGGGTTYTKGTDYEMDYANGEIKVLSGGSMADNTTYEIDYEYQTGFFHQTDVISPADNRFSYTLDNDNGGSGGYLDGPELYPDSFTFALDLATTSWNITDGTLTTTWDDTTGNQAIQLRLTDQTWFPNDGSENNTSSVTTDFGSEVGSAVQGRATFSRYGSRTTATPQTGFNNQEIQSWEITFDGNDIPVFSGSETFEGSQLEVAQQMHQRARMRFTLEHSKTDLPVESYRPEDNVKTLPELDKRSQTTRTDLGEYYNKVTVRSNTVSGSTNSHTVSDQQAINEDGERVYTVNDPSLKTLEALKVEARAILVEKLREREDKGEIEVAPIDIPAGYGRDNPFNDDSNSTIPIEEVSYQISNGDVSGRLTFDFRTGARLASDISGLRRDTRSAKLGF